MELFTQVFQEPPSSIAYEISRRLTETFPDLAILEGEECEFNFDQFVKDNRCFVELDLTTHPQFSWTWYSEDGAIRRTRTAWYQVHWSGHQLQVILAHWKEDTYSPAHWIVASSEEVALGFFKAVCSWKPPIVDQVLVFEGGWWARSESLFKSIQNASLANLILPDSLKSTIVRDLDRFFASKTVYEAHGVPWKRGMLFIGPPGNGKTHMVKALVNHLGKPCLYVKSFSADRTIDATNVRKVFTKAREMAPCIVVMEDLDSLVTSDVRSFFLNEMDGFAGNSGVVVLGTTNHPEKLDPAILDRPSRFDRKYHFNLPSRDERLAYASFWNTSLEDALRVHEDDLARLADATEGFSFAYLKELFLSGVMAWIEEARPGGMGSVLLELSQTLKLQMSTSTAIITNERDQLETTMGLGLNNDD